MKDLVIYQRFPMYLKMFLKRNLKVIQTLGEVIVTMKKRSLQQRHKRKVKVLHLKKLSQVNLIEVKVMRLKMKVMMMMRVKVRKMMTVKVMKLKRKIVMKELILISTSRRLTVIQNPCLLKRFLVMTRLHRLKKMFLWNMQVKKMLIWMMLSMTLGLNIHR